MNDDAEPRWELLPHSPEEFFGLEGDYDLRDLKRKYNALIRRFKPERFPDQFQKIRAAFERLDDDLRYGETGRRAGEGVPVFDWSGPVRSTGADSVSDDRDSGGSLPEEDEPSRGGCGPAPRSNQPAAAGRIELALLDRIAAESPRNLYDELRRLPEKSPFDYFALAALSDVVQSERPEFAGWLLSGLKAHPNDPGLVQLVREFLATEVTVRSAPKMLVAVSRIVRNDRFYYLTERLWDRLLRDAPFEMFRRTLDDCEANLLDHRFDHQTTFYLHMLRAALWKADDRWLDDAFARVESQHVDLPRWAELELHFLDCLRTYRDRRAEFLKIGGPIRARMDRAIVDYCLCDEPEADRRLLECQNLLATSGERLMLEFPVPPKNLDFVMAVWERIADEVADRSGEEPAFDDDESQAHRIAELARRMMRASERREFQSGHAGVVVGGFLLALLAAGGIGFAGYRLVTSLFGDSRFILGSIMCVVMVVVVLVVLAAMGLILVLGVSELLIGGQYRLVWRRQILDFIARTRLAPETIADEVAALKGTKIEGTEIEFTDEIASHVRSDPALALFATAQRLLV